MTRRFEHTVEVKGHLIDSSILTRIFDTIMDQSGEFEVLQFDIGKNKNDESYAKLLINADSQKKLDEILESVYREGATSKVQKEVKTKPAPKDMVMPQDFYSTTNNRTQIFHKQRWIEVQNMMMDKCIVVKNETATCTLMRDVKKGDKVVVGEQGVRIIPPQRPREGVNIFQFMGSGSSSERPTHHIARSIARDFVEARKKGGKIILVGGPAIVHTGAADAVASMIRSGHINGILAGNALAVHDIEYATLGTSLGMNVHDGSHAYRGHRNHIATVNEVFRAGSIKKMVQKKRLKKGIMYEAIKNNVPFVLASSIRDDGPLPDVITDVTAAQKKYKQVLKDAHIVLMVSTMLHSIATGNMTPADVKVVVVDINQSTVTKLVDRGTWQALGIVTDVGMFLPLLASEIDKLNNSSQKKTS